MCASVLECKNLIASPFTSPLKTLWGERKRNTSIGRCLFFLKCVLLSRRLVVLNLSPLTRLRSRNSMHSSLMLHVNFCGPCLAYLTQTHRISLPYKRLDRFLGKKGSFKPVHE